MKRQPREVYGFGTGLPTRCSAPQVARLVLVAFTLATVAALCVLSW